MRRAAASARLLVATGDPERAREFTAAAKATNALLVWETNGQSGDWYVERPSSSLLTAPLAGVVFALLITGTNFNVASFMGLIMVIGIVAKNGILLLDADEQLRFGSAALAV